jgi:hypothetical protein
MNKIYLFALSGMLLASCGGSTNTAKDNSIQEEETKKEKPVEMTFEEALDYQSGDRKQVIIEGYVQLSVISNFTATSQSVNLYGHRNQTTGKYIYTNMPIGTGKNQMKQLPKEYHPSDVVMMDQNGKKIGANQRVRLQGELYAIESYSKKKDYTIYLEVTGIEYVDEVKEDYAAMKLPTLDGKGAKSDKNYDKAFKIEGKLEVPMFVLIDNETTVDIVTANNEKISLKVVTGNGESQIEELKENWSEADVKIRNSNGQLISKNKKVTVYGTLGMDGLHVEQIVQ